MSKNKLHVDSNKSVFDIFFMVMLFHTCKPHTNYRIGIVSVFHKRLNFAILQVSKHTLTPPRAFTHIHTSKLIQQFTPENKIFGVHKAKYIYKYK